MIELDRGGSKLSRTLCFRFTVHCICTSSVFGKQSDQSGWFQRLLFDRNWAVGLYHHFFEGNACESGSHPDLKSPEARFLQLYHPRITPIYP